MKRATITAYNGLGDKKVLAGTREVNEPETLDEAIANEVEDGEEDGAASVLGYYWGGKTIEIQRQIRAKTTMSAKATLAAIQAYVRQNPDSETAKTLVALKIGVAGVTAIEDPTPTPPPANQAPATEPPAGDKPADTPPAQEPEAPAKGRGKK